MQTASVLLLHRRCAGLGRSQLHAKHKKLHYDGGGGEGGKTTHKEEGLKVLDANVRARVRMLS